MRCLFCGKELALLKRWTGGGEFCSEAHRQQYQEEYNQLALNRLLQAKPKENKPAGETKAPPESKAASADLKPVESRKPREAPPPSRPAPAQAPAQAPSQTRAAPVQQKPTPAQAKPAPARRALPAPVPEPVAYIAPVAPPEPEPEAPAEAAGFLFEMPVAVLAEVMEMSRVESDLETVATPSLPHRESGPWGTQLSSAGLVVAAPANSLKNYVSHRGERTLEVRDFVRGTSVIEVNFPPNTATGLETSAEPMDISVDILVSSHPPQASPALWQEGEREFGAVAIELGALARVVFRTTGLKDNEEGEGESLAPLPTEPTEAVERATPAASPVSVPEVASNQIETKKAEEKKFEAGVESKKVEPAKVEPAKVEPVKVESKRFEAKVEMPVPLKPPVPRPPLASKEPEKPPPQPPAKKAEPVPDLVTKPLPLTLHGLAAGKGKPVQIFQSAAQGGIDVRAPRSTALPLRPLMVLGPAPAAPPKSTPVPAPAPAAPAPANRPADKKPPERTVVVKTEPQKLQPQRPDPPVVTTKVRKPEVRVVTPERKEPAAPPVVKARPDAPRPDAPRPDAPRPNAARPEASRPDAARPVEKRPAPPAAAVSTTPKEKPREMQRPMPRREPTLPPPNPQSTPQPAADLGLPSLSLSSSSEGFMSKLSMGVKIGIAAGILAVVGGIVFMMRGSSDTAASTNTGGVQIGVPLAITETGWITDWGNEPGAPSHKGQILMLRPSLNLTDYRMEFQSKIETKALGWAFRAKDAKNFYVTKLEVLKPGLNPSVAVVHFAVINGEEQKRTEASLPMPVRQDTLYKIHFEAIGNHFTTSVLDHKVDDWTDDRISSGGVGLYNERGESASLKGGVSVVPLKK